MVDHGREVDMALGNRFAVTPQIKGAIKAISGVVNGQDLQRCMCYTIPNSA